MPMLSDIQREALLAELGGLRKFCVSLAGSVADGDDLLQTTVERVLEKGMPDDAHVAKWAYRVCKNAWIDEAKRRIRLLEQENEVLRRAAAYLSQANIAPK